MAELILSAALIVRNEEKCLAGCLQSIAGLVDETVVVDTGSTDRSREIACDLGARLDEFPWCDDFAAARNRALDLARGSWILYIDADERVSAGTRAELDPLLARPEVAACTVRFRPLSGFTRYREYRVFRNRPDLRFEGVIHETYTPALFALCVREDMRIVDSTLAIDHLGYDGDLATKHRRNLPLLRARLEADPSHVYSWSHLGSTLYGMGDVAGAEQAWRRGVAVVRAKRDPGIADSGPYCDLVRSLLARGEDVSSLLNEATELFPGHFTLQWLRARWLAQTKRYGEALPILERLIAVRTAEIESGPLAHDERIFGRFAYEALGLCCFGLRRFRESAGWYGRAEELSPEPLENRIKRQLAASLIVP